MWWLELLAENFVVVWLGLVGLGISFGHIFRKLSDIAVKLADLTAQCSRPLPGDRLPWERCSGGCTWCDHMVEFDLEEATEDHSGPALGPYRTLEEKRADWEADQEARRDDPMANLPQGYDIRLVLQCNSQMHREDVFVALHGADLITTEQYHEYISSKPEWIDVTLDQPEPGIVIE